MLSTIDLHGCSQSEAKVKLDHFLKGTSILVKEVTIVHGYSSSILLNYVRKKYSHPRIERKILTLNKGETVFILNNGKILSKQSQLHPSTSFRQNMRYNS